MKCVHICIRYKKEAHIGLNFLHNLLTHLDFYIACSQGGGGGVLGLVFCFVLLGGRVCVCVWVF